ncbi:hypothetical protein D3C77_383360 [compost metagenome]
MNVNSCFRMAICLCCLYATACTTQKALQETGKEIDNGNYGAATWYAVTLPIAMIYDVATLGGTADPETVVNTATSIANQSSDSNGNVTPEASTTNTTSTSQVTYAQAGTGKLTAVSGTGPESAVSSSNQASDSPPEQSTKSITKKYQDASHCLQRDSTSNSIADFWVNSCSFTVTVMWFDTNGCKDGCMIGVGANDRASTNKGTPGSNYTWVGCPKPSTPRGPDGVRQWKNEGHHICAW